MATFTGTDGEDNLNGGANDDSLFGLGGRDRLNGGAGNDLLDGGDGDDFAIYTDAASGVTVDLRNLSPQDTIGAGIDTLIGIENIYGSNFADTLTGDANANFILGGAGSDTLVGNGGADTLSGGTGVDTMIGGSGDDAYFVDTPADVIVEQANDGIDLMLVGETGLSFVLPDNVENMRVSTVFPGIATLTGNSLNNIIEGSHFTTDVIDGGVGADTMIGYQGDDSYYVDNAGDVVVEAAGAGFEQVFASVSYALTDNVENLTLTGTQAIDGTGNALNNVITGNANNNVISGGAGGDILSGGAGNDTLIGGSGDDQLSGGAGDDLLIEGAYAGPRTNDIYDGGDGVDTVDLHNAPAGVTVDLRIAGAQNTGGDGIDTFIGVENIIGTAFDDVLIGVANVRNEFYGGAGNDYFDGGAGQDLIDGGSGIDTVSYDSASGPISINLAMGGGNGDGLSSIENIIGSAFDDVINGSDVDNRLFGQAGNDYLYGAQGNDQLNGGLGADTLIGGTGDDQYFIDLTDTIVEGAGEGVDTIYTFDQSYTLSANLENLVLFGTVAVNGTGNGSANRIDGNSGANILSGGAGDDNLLGEGGNDRLVGGDGFDNLTGGSGADVFADTVANWDFDFIRDMASEDRIIISDADITTFSFSFHDNTIFFSGGSIFLNVVPTGRLVASAASGGGVELRWAPRAVVNDFNGDGRSDILWRNVDGAVGDWLGDANGNFAVNSAVPLRGVPLAWHIAGTGDFNGDGRSDILWRNDSGAVGDWLGTATGDFTVTGVLINVPTEWKIAGTGDFNGDGKTDILWRNASGTIGNWLGTTDGNFAITALSVPVSNDWKIVGTGDFNGDGRTDILWRSIDGRVGDWLGNAGGGFDINPSPLIGVPNEWKVAGTGDFNGDGRSDILWRNDDGRIGDWLGTATGGFTVTSLIVAVPNEWHVAATGDYNGDGRDDILWRNDNGAVGNWLGNPGGDFTINGGLYQVPTSWHVQPDGLL